MALTEQQVDNIMHQSVEKIMLHISQGRIIFPDDLKKYSNDPKFKEIERRIESIPDPAATAQWATLKAKAANDAASTTLAAELTAFVNRYSANSGCAPMVTQARDLLAKMTQSVEGDDWDNVDRQSVNALLAHRRKYPTTAHEVEIDNLVWELLDLSMPAEVRRYIAEFPAGVHRGECDSLLEAQDLWKGVATDPDLLTVSDYIHEMPSSPFFDDAVKLVTDLKRREIDKMKENPGKYDVRDLTMLLDNDIFTEDELIDAGVATQSTIKFIANPEELPDIEQVANDNPVIHSGATDVFLFGIPSSGKTCVLMGLLGATDFAYDNATEGRGGDYADSLKVYRDKGKAPGRTYGNFVTQIPGKIYSQGGDGLTYPINLIEMSGEEFAMKIAYNSANTVNFEDMGTGATKLLSSGNPKVIFIIVDPTADGLIKISTNKDDGTEQTKIVQQDIVINKIVNMLSKNTSVLKRTNAIHFIMTKADTLGDREERENESVKRISSLYRHTINNLKELCREYGINATSQHAPMLFTFSLGTFYVGDLFEYDVQDADKIMDSLKSMSQAQRKKGFFSTVKGTVN